MTREEGIKWMRLLHLVDTRFAMTKEREERLICFIHLSIIHVTSGKYPWVRNVSRLLPEVSRGEVYFLKYFKTIKILF